VTGDGASAHAATKRGEDRIGWSAGIRLSDVTVDSIVTCRVVVPRMLNLRKLNTLPQDSHTRATLSRAVSGLENQHPARGR